MTQEVMSPPAFPCLIDSIQSLYYELMVGGRDLQEQGKRALTANKNYRYGPSLKRRWTVAG